MAPFPFLPPLLPLDTTHPHRQLESLQDTTPTILHTRDGCRSSHLPRHLLRTLNSAFPLAWPASIQPLFLITDTLPMTIPGSQVDQVARQQQQHQLAPIPTRSTSPTCPPRWSASRRARPRTTWALLSFKTRAKSSVTASTATCCQDPVICRQSCTIA